MLWLSSVLLHVVVMGPMAYDNHRKALSNSETISRERNNQNVHPQVNWSKR